MTVKELFNNRKEIYRHWQQIHHLNTKKEHK